jgi:hypothetical protein
VKAACGLAILICSKLVGEEPAAFTNHSDSLPGWTNVSLTTALYQSRYLSASGRLFFNAADALIPQDSSGTFDVYEYEPPQGPGEPANNTCTAASNTYSPKSLGCFISPRSARRDHDLISSRGAGSRSDAAPVGLNAPKHTSRVRQVAPAAAPGVRRVGSPTTLRGQPPRPHP